MKIYVDVHPNSSKEEIKKIDEDNYIVWINEKAENGKANLKIIKILKRYFKCAEVKIKSGIKSRKKILEIEK